MSENNEMQNGSARKMIPVTSQFWEELGQFLEQNEIKAMDLKRAGINYNLARKIVTGTITAHSVNSDYMITFVDMVNDPEKYKTRVMEGAISSLSDMLNMNNLTSNLDLPLSTV